MSRQTIGRKTAVFITLISTVTLVILGTMLMREAPYLSTEPVAAVRLGIDDIIRCHDPASCTRPSIMGQVRVPSQYFSCATLAEPQKARCHLSLGGQPLQFVVRFSTSEQAKIESCTDASFAGQPIACQPIYHYPVSEVAFVTLPSVDEGFFHSLRRQYPLTQLSSADWWFVSLLITGLVMMGIGSVAWLLSQDWERSRRFGFTAGSAIGSMLVAGVTILVLLTTLNFPID